MSLPGPMPMTSFHTGGKLTNMHTAPSPATPTHAASYAASGNVFHQNKEMRQAGSPTAITQGITQHSAIPHISMHGLA